VIVAAIGLKITRLPPGKVIFIYRKFVDVLARLYCDTGVPMIYWSNKKFPEFWSVEEIESTNEHRINMLTLPEMIKL